MRLLASLAILIPASALAQPSEPAPPPEPAPMPAPAPPPPPGYYAPPPPTMYAAAPVNLHNGMTFEANIGLGWIHASADGGSDTSDLGLGGLDIGVGGWINPKLAITGRIAGVTLSDNGARLTSGVLVGSAQYWVDDHFWFGGGAGLGLLGFSGQGAPDPITGLGLDLRAGYTFVATTENTFNVSLELTPTFLSENGSSATFTGIGILLGYQHL